MKSCCGARATSKAGPQDVSVPISFEGNDVFDPGHVTAICLELDEGNVNADQVNRFTGAIVGPVFDRRDAIEHARIRRRSRPGDDRLSARC